MVKPKSKRGAAMVIVIVTTVLLSMMAFSLIFASSSLVSSANRKWIQVRMEQQAVGMGEVLSQSIVDSAPNSLKTGMNFFLNSEAYTPYSLEMSEFQKQAAIYTFLQGSVALPGEYGEVTLQIRKIFQYPSLLLTPDVYTFLPTNTSGLSDYLSSVTDDDYLLIITVTVMSAQDEQAVGTAEVGYLRTIQYIPEYYLNTFATGVRIYPDATWNFYTDPNLSSGRVTFQANDRIKAQCDASNERREGFVIAEGTP